MIEMRMRVKISLALAAIAVVAFLVIVAAVNVFVLPAFERAESEEVGEGLTRALNVINISISQIESSTKTGRIGTILTSFSRAIMPAIRSPTSSQDHLNRLR